MMAALRAFARFQGVPDGNPSAIDWPVVQYSDVVAFRQSIVDQAPATVRVKLAAVKGVLKCAWRDGLITAEQLARVCDITPPRVRTLPRGRSLTSEEIAAIFAACSDGTPIGARDAAAFALFRTGMRVSELLAVDLADYEPNGATATVKIRHGKGGHQRLAYLSGAALGWIERWIDLRGRDAGPLICGLRGGRVDPTHRVRPLAIEKMCHKRGEQAGLPPFTPHDFRRTVATQLKDKGVDIADIRDFLGHANIQTTVAYFRHDKEEAKRRAALTLDTPGGEE